MPPGHKPLIGFIRDRTKKYKEKWEALHPNAGAAQFSAADRLGRALGGATDSTALLGAGPGSDAMVVEMGAVPQDLVMETEQRINRELASASQLLKSLKDLQAAAQAKVFGLSSEDQDKIEVQRAELRRVIKRIHDLIASLTVHATSDKSRDIAMRIQRAKATALADIAMELNRQEIRDIQARTHKVPGMNRGQMDNIFTALAEPTPAYTEQQMQHLNNIQQEYEQRDAAIAELVKEVTEIQEIMRDMNQLVVEQGAMVDRIDQNIQAAGMAVERGAENIRRAHETSKKSLMTTCIFGLLIAISIALILMVIMHL